MAPRARLLVTLVAVVIAMAACTRDRPPATVATPAGPAAAATVDHVIDGDTVQLTIGSHTERARLLGIDTPETVKPGAPVQCYGPEASARTKALLPTGTRVGLQRDAESRDRYGRLLVYVWRVRDGRFVNRSLVAEGYARTLSIAPNTAHRGELAGAEAEARRAGLGLWARCPEPG